MTYSIAVCTVKLPDDGQRNCQKHVEFYSKNKFEKFVASSWFYCKRGEFEVDFEWEEKRSWGGGGRLPGRRGTGGSTMDSKSK